MLPTMAPIDHATNVGRTKATTTTAQVNAVARKITTTAST
jgi:hypothetical protein